MADPHLPDPDVSALLLRQPNRGNPLVTTAVVLVAIVVLYLGAGILVPLVLAVLLAFALAPLIRRLRRLHLPHILAVVVAVLAATSVLATIGYVVATQLIRLASDLPSYQATVAAKTRGLQHSLGDSGFIEGLTSAISQLSNQFSGVAAASAVTPTPVTITNGGVGPIGLLQTVLGSVLGPLATAAIVLVFLVFLLLEREDIRDRFLKLVSRGDLRTSTKVMNEAANRVGRYLLVQFGVNLTYGVVFGLGLTLIGVPNAILWGLLAAMFRYIPFVGTIIAATIPFTLAFAVDPGWSMLTWSIALYAGLELVITNAIEPRLYGSSTGLSAIAVLIAAMFWATLWGPIGLILSTPMTVCLVVLGRYVPQLAFFETLLGSEPVMTPPERFYQRLVSANVEDAVELADEYVAGHNVAQFYTQVAMPAMLLAEADLSHNPADLAPRRNVVDCMTAVLDDIDLEQNVAVAALPATVLCIGGRTELDETAAQLLVRLLQDEQIPAKALTPLAIRQESISQLAIGEATVVCLCYLGEHPRSYVRFVAKRLRRRFPDLQLIACALGPRTNIDRQADWGVDSVVTSLEAAAGTIKIALATVDKTETEPLLPAPIDDATLDQLRHLAHSEGPLSTMLGEIAASADVPVAILDVAESDLRAAVDRSGEAGGLSTVSAHVIETKSSIVIPNVAESPDFATDPFLLENGVRFYAGVPLVADDGKAIGALALLDSTPRSFSEAQLEALELQALRILVALNQITTPRAEPDHELATLPERSIVPG